MRSPFLKLSAVFESVVLNVVLPSRQASTDAADPESRPALCCSRRSCGVVQRRSRRRRVACRARQRWRFQPDRHHPTKNAPARSDAHDGRLHARLRAPPEGHYELARTQRSAGNDRRGRPRPTVVRTTVVFHARRRSDLFRFSIARPLSQQGSEYRLAYREAWFEDDALRHVLAHWPHYMTLDDHEIADQFAVDLHTAEKGHEFFSRRPE